MRPEGEHEVEATAIGWRLRLRDGSAADWEAFTAWLEAAPGNATAYDRVALADQDVEFADDRQPMLAAANDDDPQPRRRWWLPAGAGIAAAAAIALIVAVPGFRAATALDVVTAPGEQRLVTLADGSAVTVGGNSQLILDRSAGRRAELRRGEAVFKVRHDAAVPFVVMVGDDRIVDVGTVFTVTRGEGNLRVAVAEGSVRYNPDAENVLLLAGDSISRTAGGPVVRSHAAAGATRQGRLDFSDAPLRSVAVTLSRNLGTPVSVDPDIAGRSFSGTIIVGPPAPTLARFAVLAGVAARPDGDGWRLQARGRGAN